MSVEDSARESKSPSSGQPGAKCVTGGHTPGPCLHPAIGYGALEGGAQGVAGNLALRSEVVVGHRPVSIIYHAIPTIPIRLDRQLSWLRQYVGFAAS